MNTSTQPYSIRPATYTDQAALQTLLEEAPTVHTHPDWQAPTAWINTPPFLVAVGQNGIAAALSLAPDPADTAWIRVAVAAAGVSPAEPLTLLWQVARQELQRLSVQRVTALMTSIWLRPLVARWGFEAFCSVIVLQHTLQPPAIPPSQTHIRRATVDDLDTITQIDQAAFAPPWQYSHRFTGLALRQTDYATVLEAEGQIVGYQMSTGSRQGGHLARLAVLPGCQRRGFGRTLVADVIRHFNVCQAPYVTVNTPDTNHASLHLYQKLGFTPTGDHYPVWQYTF